MNDTNVHNEFLTYSTTTHTYSYHAELTNDILRENDTIFVVDKKTKSVLCIKQTNTRYPTMCITGSLAESILDLVSKMRTNKVRINDLL